MALHIDNIRTYTAVQGHEIIVCDRSSAVYGNPFLLANESDRSKVCEAHLLYLMLCLMKGWEPLSTARMISDKLGLKLASSWRNPTIEALRKAVLHLKDLAEQGEVTLLCWCSPKQCHCDNYKALLESPFDIC
jgi:hypothetical protein